MRRFIIAMTAVVLCLATAMATDAIVSVDRSMAIMESTATPETIAEFTKSHPAPFWLFGEDRQLSARCNRIPAHWFAPADSTDDIRDFNRLNHFSGTAQPGEFYVFQTVIVCNKSEEFTFTGEFKMTDSAGKVEPIEFRFINTSPVIAGKRGFEVGPSGLYSQPIWTGFSIPKDATGKTISGTVTVTRVSDNAVQKLDVELPIAGDVVEEDGVKDSWRLARLEWLDSNIYDSDTIVAKPFTPIELNKEKYSIKILGRAFELNAFGLPAQYYSFFSASNTRIEADGKPFWCAVPDLIVTLGEKKIVWNNEAISVTKIDFPTVTPNKVCWTAQSKVDNIILTVDGSIEADGFVAFNMRLKTADGKPVEASSVSYDFAVPENLAQLYMGLGQMGRAFPDSVDWKWNAKHHDRFWFGAVNAGMQIQMKDDKYVRPLINCYYKYRPLTIPESWGTGGVKIEKKDGKANFSLYAGKTVLCDKELDFRLDISLTPFKPIDLARHLNDRYVHTSVGNPPEPFFDAVKKEGANCSIIHHNNVQNPYINYPYNDDSFALLQSTVKAAHDRDLRLKVYYTTRELTQNLPEFFALRSLGDEIFMPLKPNVGWPVTNAHGPHPWLNEHVGKDVIPAWREHCRFKEYPSRYDVSIITTPDSRWNNFYVEGLQYLVKNADIDGIYIDDTALDRRSIRRARLILDADGNTGRRIDNHSWSHFTDLAGNISSALCYSEIYPYVDSLWYGEGFNYGVTPECWITEMSGLPYGLMSQMLQGGGSPWRGITLAMTQRHRYNGNMTPLWKFFDQTDLSHAEFIGFWDPANPATSSRAMVKVTTYAFKDRLILAVGNFAHNHENATIRLQDKDQKFSDVLTIRAIEGFQSEQTIQAQRKDGCLEFQLPVDEGKGFFIETKAK